MDANPRGCEECASWFARFFAPGSDPARLTTPTARSTEGSPSSSLCESKSACTGVTASMDAKDFFEGVRFQGLAGESSTAPPADPETSIARAHAEVGQTEMARTRGRGRSIAAREGVRGERLGRSRTSSGSPSRRRRGRGRRGCRRAATHLGRRASVINAACRLEGNEKYKRRSGRRRKIVTPKTVPASGPARRGGRGTRTRLVSRTLPRAVRARYSTLL